MSSFDCLSEVEEIESVTSISERESEENKSDPISKMSIKEENKVAKSEPSSVKSPSNYID